MGETTWTDPKTGTDVRVGDVWQDKAPLYTGMHYPLRTVDVVGFMFDAVRSKQRQRVQARRRDFRFKGRLIKGHLVTIQCAAFVKRFTLVQRPGATEPAADPNALKPCPFCGGTDIGMHEYGDSRAVSCGTCDCEGPRTNGERDTDEETEAEARRLWNGRAEARR